MAEANWYVVHTYSGYENKVKVDIEKTIENRKLQDEILEVRVPLEDVVEMRNGVKKQVSRKMFPGYVLIHMIMNDDTWYVVRNTRGVTGFVGPGSKPVPLTPAEMKPLGIQIGGEQQETPAREKVELDIEVGDMIVVTSGAWEGTTSAVTAINESKQTVTIEVEMFGRATSVEIDFLENKNRILFETKWEGYPVITTIIRRLTIMAKKVEGYIKLQIPAGKATPAPPVGPALGQHGVNIVQFTKEFNARTADQGDMIIPVVITVYQDRSFSFITKTPPAAVLLKKACKIQSGSGEPNRTKVATISKADLQQIAETKMKDLNAASIEAAMSMIAGTARSMGITVEE